MSIRLSRSLKYAQIFFYLAFISFWFKDNFSILRKINIPWAVPLFLLLAVSIFRFVVRRRQKRVHFRITPRRSWLAPISLALIATTVRIPFFLFYRGLFNSDDAISLLMIKHISTGKFHPIYQYGQDYIGTPALHLYALVTKIFGFSFLAPALTYFLFYLGFILIQYVIFKEMTASKKLSFIMTLFYCLPVGELLGASFYFSTGYSLYFLLGGLSLYLSLLVYKYDRRNLLPAIGLVLGLAFWLHPITLIYALCSIIFLAVHYRFQLKRYLVLAAYFIIGAFPVVLNEIDHKFATVRFLFSGQKYSGDLLKKAQLGFHKIIGLITPEPSSFGWVFVVLIMLGIIYVIGSSVRQKALSPEIIFIVFFLLYLPIYVFSKFSVPVLTGTRYLYPLYFAIPFLLFSPFRILPKKIRLASMVALLLLIIAFNNARETYANYLEVKRSDANLKMILKAMKTTGERYWAGEFWEVILLAGLSAEDIIGWSYTHEDYYPYKLMYFNKGNNNNYVFFRGILGSHALVYKDFGDLFSSHLDRAFREAERFIQLLQHLKIPAKTQRVGDCWLIYDVSAQVFPQAIKSYIPRRIPEVTLSKIQKSGEHLTLTFNNSLPAKGSGFRLGVEIPRYSSCLQEFSPLENEIQATIPFPAETSFKIRYYLEYIGLRIPATIKEAEFSPARPKIAPSPGAIVCLSGFGPEIDVSGKTMKICTKKTKFKIDFAPGKTSRLVLDVFSPFEFSNPYWYGDYVQQVEIYVNNRFMRTESLRDGLNRLELRLDHPLFRRGVNIISLYAKYHLPFEFAPLWKTSFLLQRTEFE